MLESRGIRQGTEVFVKDVADIDKPERKAHVFNVYPYPSTLLVVQYDDDGSMEQVESTQVTTLYEMNRRSFY